MYGVFQGSILVAFYVTDIADLLSKFRIVITKLND